MSLPSIDALLPPDMAKKAEKIGAQKAAMPRPQMFALAVLAGAFIALGAMFSTTSATGATEVLPYGLTRVVAGLSFSLGLVLVVVAGAELFTGNNLLVMAWLSRRVQTTSVLRSWAVVYLGNFVGAVLTAILVFQTGHHEAADGSVGAAAVRIAADKCELAFAPAFFRGVLCNGLVCLAVWLSFSARSTTDRILAVVGPVTAFVACGFEHCIANMYFIPYGIWVANATATDAAAPTYGGLVANLIPVTLGNLVGGSLLVGTIYWWAYRPSRHTGS